MRISSDEIHLWLVPLKAVASLPLEPFQALMNKSERDRNRRYRVAHMQRTDCVTRALVRRVLSEYAGVPPADWHFEAGAHGKPEISTPSIEMPLRFNLSHSRDYVACAVALHCDVGVDVECIERKNDVLSIAEHYFSPQEVEDLFALPRAQQEQRFFDYWTLKEAYMKARGEGISLGLSNFSFQIRPSGEVGICFEPALNDDPEAWQFWQLHSSKDHRIALAAKTEGQPRTMKLMTATDLFKNL